MHKPSLNKKLYFETKSTLRRTSYGQNCISFLAPSVWGSLPNELKRCTNLNTFKHKIKEYFLLQIRQITKSIFTTNFFLHNNWCIFTLTFVFSDIIPFINLPILFKDHNRNKATWMLCLCYLWHWSIIYHFKSLVLRIRFYFSVISWKL